MLRIARSESGRLELAAERGHAVTVFEAADQPGGQIRLTALQERRREMISIIAWRQAMCEKHGVTFNFNTFAEAEDVLATDPDEVIIATGGLPHTEVLTQGNDLVVSAWDILSGDVKPGQNVLVYDDAGDHAAAATQLEELRSYNEYDCLSTLRLRDWLLAHAG